MKLFHYTNALNLVQITNFSLYYNNRANTTGGGISIYGGDKKYEILYQKYIDFQILVKRISRIFAQKMRFPNTLNYCLLISGRGQNLDLLKMSQHENTETFLDIYLEYKMIQSIYRPTRVTHSSARLINSIYNNSQLPLHSHILTDDLSDHFTCLVSCELPLKRNLTDARPTLFSQGHFLENIYLILH